jgi:hypothetical protein
MSGLPLKDLHFASAQNIARRRVTQCCNPRLITPYQGSMVDSVCPWHSLPTMRVNIKARIPMHLYQEFHSLPLVLTIETAHGLAARCEHRTTAAELMWTLDQKTNINSGLLDRFRQKLRLIEEANLSDVDLSDEVLDMFGFFL